MNDILEFIDDEDSSEEILEMDDLDDLELEGTVVEIAEVEIDDDQLSEMKARELTNAIKAAAEATYVLLARAHHGKAYKALGYDTWADYVNQEFEITTQRSYQLLNLSKTIEALEAVAPEGTPIKLTEAQARDIKRELPFITSKIAEETADLDKDEAAERIDEIVKEAREQKKADDKAIALKEKKLEEAEQDGYSAGLEAGADALLEASGFDLSAGQDPDDDDDGWGKDSSSSDGPGISPQLAMDLHNLVNVLAGVNALPDARELISVVPESKWEDIKRQAEGAQNWFTAFNAIAADRD